MSSEKSDRILEQYRDERMLKFEKLTGELQKRQEASEKLVGQVHASLEQYSGVLDQVKVKLEGLGGEIEKAFKTQSEAVKVYIDQRLGQTSQTSEKRGGFEGLIDRLDQRHVIDKLIERATNTFFGSTSQSVPMPDVRDSPWFIDLNQEWNKRVGYAFRNFAQKQINLLPPVPTEAGVQVVHKP